MNRFHNRLMADAPVTPPSSYMPSRAWKIAGVYAVFATLWIYFSDSALKILVPDADLRMQWSVYKGIAFVTVTSLLLLLLMKRAFRIIGEGYEALLERDRLRQEQELEITRLNRLYAALSQINQAIVWSQSREELLWKICQVLVEFGKFRMAWVGWHDAHSDTLTPVADFAALSHYSNKITSHADEQEEGRSPFWSALREGMSQICHDIRQVALPESIREEMREWGIRSLAVIPIHFRETPCGTLAVYSDESGVFNSMEMSLLDEAAVNISFALENLARAEEHRQAQIIAESERIFSDTLIESTPGVLYFYDEYGRFLRWNRNFETVTGFTGEEIATMRPADFIAPEDQEILKERIMAVFESGDSFVEASFLTKSGGRTPYFLTGRRINFKGKACLVGVGIDLSQRREAERALVELNETLEAKVTSRTEELRTALVRAEAADQLKSAFLATMSHELRTPLNSIIGFTGILVNEMAGPLNPEQSKQLRMVRGSARHLLDLINDVLDLSKIEAGQMELSPARIDTAEMAKHVADLVRPLATNKRLQLCCELEDGLGEMTGDRRRIEQILINLLNNAIKFTEFGNIVLKIDRPNHDANSIRFRVIDSGIGMQPENIKKLFQPFFQIDNGLSRHHEGSGLGLAICKRLVALMDGEIEVSSQWLSGSEFAVTLPRTTHVNLPPIDLV